MYPSTTLSEATKVSRHIRSQPRSFEAKFRQSAAKVLAKAEVKGLRTPKRLLTFTGSIPAGVYGRVSL